MPTLTPAELADALVCRGDRPINQDRVLKAIRHIDGREYYAAFLEAMPALARGFVLTELAAIAERDLKLRPVIEGWQA